VAQISAESTRKKTTDRAASAAARHALYWLDPGTEQAFGTLYGAQEFSIESVRSAIRDFLDHYAHDVVRIWERRPLGSVWVAFQTARSRGAEIKNYAPCPPP
jgi:hypothetical protein